MNSPDGRHRLRQQVERQANRMLKAKRDKPTLFGQTVYIGTLGLLMVLPVVGGAFLGHWLDNLVAGYSIRWSVSLILLGVVIGAVNIYLFVRE